MKELTNAGRYHGLLIKKRKGKRGISYQAKARKGGKPVTLTAKTKEELKEKIDRLNDGDACSSVTFKAAWEQYIADRKKTAQPNTITGYESKHNTALYMLDNVIMSEMTDSYITSLIEALKQKYSPRSIEDYMICLFTFLKWARTQGYMTREMRKEEFAAILPKAGQKPISTYSDVEFMQFIQIVRSPRVRKGREMKTEQFVLCYAVMYYAGLRISEALAIRGKDVHKTPDGLHVIEVKQKAEKVRDKKGKYIQHISRTLKSDSARRMVPIDEWLYNDLKAISTDDEALIFSELNIVTFSASDRAIKKRAREAGVKVITCHELRKSCLTRWAESGMPPMVLKVLAGHTSIQITEKYYIKTDIQKAAMSAASYMLKNEKESKNEGHEAKSEAKSEKEEKEKAKK